MRERRHDSQMDLDELNMNLGLGQADARNCANERTARPSDSRVAGDIASSWRGVWLRGQPRENPDESVRDADRVSNLTLPIDGREVRRERR